MENNGIQEISPELEDGTNGDTSTVVAEEKKDIVPKQRVPLLEIDEEIEPASPEAVAADQKILEGDVEEDDGWLKIIGNDELKKKVLVQGKKDVRATMGEMVRISYKECLSDGTLVDEKKDVILHTGEAMVAQGLDLAIPLMDEGETAEVIVSPRFGYGDQGLEPNVPPKSWLTYTIELHEILHLSVDTMTNSQRLQYGEEKRERGNFWFGRKDYAVAIQCYRQALALVSEVDPVKDEEEVNNKLQKSQLNIYNNMAIAQMKTQAYDMALQSLESVLAIEPDNVKALYRNGKIKYEKGDMDECIKAWEKMLTLEPDNKAVLKELNLARTKRVKDRKREKVLYQKMLGQPKSDEKEKLKNSKTKLAWPLLVGSLVAVAVGVAVVRFRPF